MKQLLLKLLIASFAILLGSNQLLAKEVDKSLAEHKVVLQISDNDPGTQTKVLNVATQLRKNFGQSNIDIEIVAFNKGLNLLFENNSNKIRIDGLAMGGVQFTACSNTIKGMTKKMGKAPILHEPAISRKVPGVVRIMELVSEDYILIKP